jgi:hypothetical protein
MGTDAYGTDMTNEQIPAEYNYDSFIPANFEPWMRFDESPVLGSSGPDATLWDLDGGRTSLHEQLRGHTFTVVEFGSFT